MNQLVLEKKQRLKLLKIGWCVEGAKIIELCEKGDKLLDEEVAKVYKGKKIAKGSSLSQSSVLLLLTR